jgi:translation initiation factor IF-2
VDSGVGIITKSDIQYAQAYECPIYCFRVKSPLRQEQEQVQRYNVQTLYFQHFQQLIDQIALNMKAQYEHKRRGEEAGKKKMEQKTAPVAIDEKNKAKDGGDEEVDWQGSGREDIGASEGQDATIQKLRVA